MKNRAPFEVRPGEPPPPSSDPLALLNYALQRHPESVSLVNFGNSIVQVSFNDPGGVVVEPDGPDFHERSEVLLISEAPVEVGDNLQLPPELQDAYVLIHVPRAVVDEMDEPSLLVLPPLGLVRLS